MNKLILSVFIFSAFILPHNSNAESVRSCEIPQITTIVENRRGEIKSFQDTSSRRFRTRERVRFQANSAYTGFYTVAFIDDGRPGQLSTLVDDPSGSLMFPCGQGRCHALKVRRDVYNQKHDDFKIGRAHV